MQIALVEDNEILNHHLSSQLKDQGHVVYSDRTASSFLQTVQKKEHIDVMIVDLGLPDFDGITLIKQIRRKEINSPILILTARGNWQDKVEGLEAGADDYLVKPFQSEELIARLYALARRAAGFTQSKVTAENIELDIKAKTIHVDGQFLQLTSFEYDIAAYLIKNSQKIISKQQFVDALYQRDSEVQLNNIEVIISRLRKKFAAVDHKDLISTVRGQGYQFQIKAK
ncbi:response regulator transcription factor [Aliivibrio sp. S4TY2]|uniref:response regulator transcription factor n=1 Tax=unclassified Aliivibrio TaxID=2645654 RepID=UPI002378A71A|nr:MULTISPECIES: response regulator transcription factor [unclassified Aliivibrio]MDD9157952.1 response regulator transcription factor [Aliivibrio sp. S4TY2]MDD9162227.1 response regulator transcription factor [Aliivibrio sp. S4TY1]MDD9166265.1 response regulator transcription factor [Aliivibrio sp. S4MY2]MDD9170262.1 response regulator transcription factor [Aliivibrio sp. S4MY4]MDD9187313.1 response regulator transcription factor [Aliivibrio sp. S4MY3]